MQFIPSYMCKQLLPGSGGAKIVVLDFDTVSDIRIPWDVLTLNPNAKHNPLSRLVLDEATLTRTLTIHTVQLQWGRDVPEILKAQTILKA